MRHCRSYGSRRGLSPRDCLRYLKPNGLFLANASHGDASLAALDPHRELVAVVHQDEGRYRIDRQGLDRHLIPRKPEAAGAGLVRRTGRGIAYTQTAFACIFQSG